MDEEIKQKLIELDQKIEEIRRFAKTTKKVLLWTLAIMVILFVLPLIGLIFAIPQFLSVYSDYGSLLQ